jgi:hypothetical protein
MMDCCREPVDGKMPMKGCCANMAKMTHNHGASPTTAPATQPLSDAAGSEHDGM